MAEEHSQCFENDTTITVSFLKLMGLSYIHKIKNKKYKTMKTTHIPACFYQFLTNH